MNNNETLDRIFDVNGFEITRLGGKLCLKSVVERKLRFVVSRAKMHSTLLLKTDELYDVIEVLGVRGSYALIPQIALGIVLLEHYLERSFKPVSEDAMYGKKRIIDMKWYSDLLNNMEECRRNIVFKD